MKKNLPLAIASFTFAFMLAFCIFRINSLEDEIRSLRNEISYYNDSVSRNINAIYNNVDNMIRQQASLITDDSWQFTSADIENGTVQLHCSVTVKEYTPGVTQAFLYAGEKEYPLNLENGSFSGDITLPLFGPTEVSTLSFVENGTVRNQELDWYINPRYEYLTIVYADMSWNGHGGKSAQDGIYNWQVVDGKIAIDVDRKNGPVEIKSMYMVEEIDGVEVKRTKIPLDYSSTREKEQAAGEWQTTVPAVPEYPEDYAVTNFGYDLSGYVFEIPFGSTLNVFVESVDSDNLVHRNQLQSWTVDEKGSYAEENYGWWHGAESFIYDKDGNLLYGNEELYY